LAAGAMPSSQLEQQEAELRERIRHPDVTAVQQGAAPVAERLLVALRAFDRLGPREFYQRSSPWCDHQATPPRPTAGSSR
jgi:hypothetical protein